MEHQRKFLQMYNDYKFGVKHIIRKANNLPDDFPLPDKIDTWEEWEKVKEGFLKEAK